MTAREATKRAALPLVLALSLLAGAGSPSARPDRRPARSAPDAGPAPDAGSRDPDQEVIDHLDEIQELDLLQNLELFGAGDERK